MPGIEPGVIMCKARALLEQKSKREEIGGMKWGAGTNEMCVHRGERCNIAKYSNYRVDYIETR